MKIKFKSFKQRYNISCFCYINKLYCDIIKYIKNILIFIIVFKMKEILLILK